MNPAEAIQAHIGGTQRAVAKVVGEYEVCWSEYIHGRKSPSADKVARWCERADVMLAINRLGHGWEVMHQHEHAEGVCYLQYPPD